MKTLVLGGTGVLGRRVVARLVESGHEVRATARGDEGRRRIAALGAAPVEIDLYDGDALRRSVDGCDAVLRLTTSIPTGTRIRSGAAWAETGRLRNQSARLLVDACTAAGVRTYVHESVVFVYADGGEDWLDEAATTDVVRWAPVRDALSGEANAARFTQAGGRGIVLRFAGFYSADSSQSRAMAEMAQRRRLALIGPSTNLFSSIHLDDAASATLASLDCPPGIYNVSDDEPLPLREVMAAMADAVGAPQLRRLPRFLGPLLLGVAWPSISRSLRVSAERLRSTTGWRPAVANARDGWRQIAADWAGGSNLQR